MGNEPDSPTGLPRRAFLRAASLGGLGLAVSGCRFPWTRAPEASAGPDPQRVWVFSDVHATYSAAGRAGEEWLEAADADIRAHVKNVSFAVCLGDITHNAATDGLAAYAAVRAKSAVGPWFELAGNQDFAAAARGVYQRHITTPLRCIIEAGNTAWFLVSAEGGGSAGFVSAGTVEWLTRHIRARQGAMNIVVCTHQLVQDTVLHSTVRDRGLHPKARVAGLLKDVRVDLWLCGHAHSEPRTPDCSAVKGRTTFVNVASLSHAYGTKRSNSAVLETTPGSRAARIRIRHHDAHVYLPGHDVRFAFPYAVRPGEPSQPITGDRPARAALPATPSRSARQDPSPRRG